MLLLLVGCQPTPLPWSVTPAAQWLHLGFPETEVTLHHNDPSGSPIVWQFESSDLSAHPTSGTLAAGDTATIQVTIEQPLAAPIGVALRGAIRSGGARLTVNLGFTCTSPISVSTLRAEREWLVGYRSTPGDTHAARDQVAALIGANRGRVLRRGAAREHDLIALPSAVPEPVLAALRALPGVLYAVANGEVSTLAGGTPLPHDPLYPQQWNLRAFGAETAWAIADLTPPSRPIVVAVIDDGVSTSHPDLHHALYPGYDVVDNNAEVRNCVDHGTHVAGIIGAERGNGVGIAGVAAVPWVKIVPVKAWANTANASTSTTFDAVIRGVRWAAGLPVAGLPENPHPADVLNLSLGSSSATRDVREAFEAVIAEVEAAGAVVIAAAGNQGINRLNYPAAAGAIAVGSIDADLSRSSFSNHGPQLTLMAPGGAAPLQATCPERDVVSSGLRFNGAQLLDDYSCKAGTSMATPYVAGAVALLLGVQPALRGNPDAIRAALMATANRYQPAGYTPLEFGAGVLCLDALVGADRVCGEP